MSKPEVIQLLHEYRSDLMRMRYPDNDEGDHMVRVRDASLRRIARAISDHEAARAEDKARIKLLEEQRDEFAMHGMAARQCIGIPASVGICEPAEGFFHRPQDLAPAMRDMATKIESLLRDADGREAQLAGAIADDRTAMGYLSEIRSIVGGSDFPEVVRKIAALAQQGKEGET